MAIVFNCPHCATNYRLKDEFGGKTATCKNPACRKVIPIPKPVGAALASTPADLDALAAAAFSDEPALAEQTVEAMIQVTCSGCDHVWSVEASKEGKNVLCPSCRRPNRVPMRKKEEKADWRTGGGGPSLAKRETGLDREGAFGTANTGGISAGTAREIVKDRDAQEEPEERRKRLVKRAIWSVVILGALGATGYFVFKQRGAAVSDAKMGDAVEELTKGPNKTDDPRYQALIHRAAGEYGIRTAATDQEAKDAHAKLVLARNQAKMSAGGKGGPIDSAGILADVANTLHHLLGTSDQTEGRTRFKKDDVVKELRHAVEPVADAEWTAEVMRSVTREFARKEHPLLAEEVARQLPNSNELIAQIGLELLRIDKEKHRGSADGLLKKLGNAETPGVQALRAALGKPAPVKKEGDAPAAPPLAAQAEADAINGKIAGAKAARNITRPEDKAKALAAVGQTLIDSNPTEAVPLLMDASKVLKEVKGSVSPWVSARVCRLLARGGQVEEAESLAASLGDEQSKAWARLEALRGRLDALKTKADDTWLDPIGDPAKLAAAAKAREVIARHNAANGGGDYQKTVKQWPPGTVRPFGTAGTVLGQQDARDK